jgi:PAS domain S-box-containing protein
MKVASGWPVRDDRGVPVHSRSRYLTSFRIAIPALTLLIGVAGFVLTTRLQAADRDAESDRRAQLQSVRVQGALSGARTFVARLGNVLQSEPERGQRRFAQLAGSASSGVGLIDVLWVQRVASPERAAYERRLGKPITRRVGMRDVRAPDSVRGYLPATFASRTREELLQGSDVTQWPGLPAAIRDRASVFAVGATLPGRLGDEPGLYLLQAADFGRGDDRRGYLAVFVPRGWLTVALGQDPRAIAIGVDGRHLEGGLTKPADSAGFDALGRRWSVEVGEPRASGWAAALPWIALTGPGLLTLLIAALGRGVRARRRAERDFERMFQLSVDPLAIAGVDGRLRRVNPAFARLLGYSSEEMLSRPMEDFVHPGDLDALRASIAELERGVQVTQVETRTLRSDGEVVTLEWSARPVAEEGLLYAAARDITERRRTERSLELLVSEQAALRRVATLVARDASPGELLDAVVREVRRLLNADSTRLLRHAGGNAATVIAGDNEPGRPVDIGKLFSLEGENMAATVVRTGRAGRQRNLDGATGPFAERLRSLGLKAAVGAPVSVEGRLWGIMIAAWKEDAALPEKAEERMSQFTELIAVAIANAEGRTQLAASRARVVATADETRRQIERDLHDSTQQRLVSLGLELRAAEAALPAELADLKAWIASAAAGTAEILEEVQEISRGIHPAILTTGGLGPALRTLARRSAVPVELDLSISGRFPEAVKVAVYFVVSEALTNAAKHARASVVRIELAAPDAAVVLAIDDDGVGGADPERGSGLIGLRDRVEALSGPSSSSSTSACRRGTRPRGSTRRA